MQQKRWRYKTNPDASCLEELKNSLQISESLALLLAQRGLKGFDDARNFFRPSLSQLHDPFLMKDMDQAVLRLEQAIDNQEKILVYGDYDVDGTTAVALFFGFLRSFYPECSYYIPDRHNEGYGVSQLGVDWAIEHGFSLIVTLDCGIKSHEMVDYGSDNNLDFIICDHHHPDPVLPNAAAVLDPKRSDCSYPFDELSGCGVGFKLMQAILINHPELTVDPFDSLDLVAVSIAADIVPITGENRVLAHFGLKKLACCKRPGLKTLLDIGQVDDITISTIIFRIAPRINSAGRIGHACAAVDLLLADSKEEATHWGNMLEGQNSVRKGTDKIITREALQMIESDSTLMAAKTTVLYKDSWHKGVIGIVASRCIEKYYRPTIILTRRSGNMVTGSARSVHGFDLYSALSSCSDLLLQYGGHMYAAGMTLKEEMVPALQNKFEEIVSKTIHHDLLIPIVDIDAVITFKEITGKFYRILKQMAPFGPMNTTPVFVSEGLSVKKIKVLKGEHLKLTVIQDDPTISFDAIGFGMAEYLTLLNSGEKFKMAYCLEENCYQGIRRIQMTIKDIKGE